MNRSKFLFSFVGLLALLWLGLWISSWWGTITLDFEKKPLATVLRSFTQQSGLKVITDLDLTKPISIHVRRVPVSEALDALQSSAESRGRLVFLAAPDRAGLQNLISFLPRPDGKSGIQSLEYRMPYMFIPGTEELPQWRDPRDQLWTPTSTASSSSLVSLFEDAAQKTEIRIFFPKDWNPKLTKSISSGPLRSSLPALAKSARAISELAFLLPAPRSENAPAPAAGSRPSPERWDQRWSEGNPLPPDAFSARLQSRLSGLPADQVKDAQLSAQDSVKQYRDWLTLSQEEKEKKMQEMIQDPNRQQRGSDRFIRSMRMMNPDQRAQRYSRYNTQKESVKDPGQTH